jgi:hypothetical protein
VYIVVIKIGTYTFEFILLTEIPTDDKFIPELKKFEHVYSEFTFNPESQKLYKVPEFCKFVNNAALNEHKPELHTGATHPTTVV